MTDKYAIIRAQGKQYTVSKGQTISIDRMVGKVGDAVTFSDVLLVSEGGSVKLGSPLLSGAKVTAKIVGQTRGKKLLTFKKNIKKGYTKRIGHRQELSKILIESIA